MADYVKSMSAVGVYGRFDLHQSFEPGINILHGKNGAGKTTFLHILTNVLNADYKRFAYLAFDHIEVHLSNDKVISISRTPEEEDYRIYVRTNGQELTSFLTVEVKNPRRAEPIVRRQGKLFVEHKVDEAFEPELPADYFPAFRTMIEAWALAQDEREPARLRSETDARRTKATRLAREVFGKFVPLVNYPSPIDIEQRLSGEVQNAVIRVAVSEQESLSQAFLDIFAELRHATVPFEETPEQILDDINHLYKNLEESLLQAGALISPMGVYVSLRDLINSFTLTETSERTVARILNVYKKSLEKRVRIQKTAFEVINRYVDAVNEFLEDKKLELTLRTSNLYDEPSVRTKFSDGSTSELQTLSSGERQIITLIYAATHMSKQRVVLIDEPEISLHVDWQRRLLRKMAEQLGDRQIIACTHSPVIAADYGDKLKMLELLYTHRLPIFPEEGKAVQEGGELQ